MTAEQLRFHRETSGWPRSSQAPRGFRWATFDEWKRDPSRATYPLWDRTAPLPCRGKHAYEWQGHGDGWAFPRLATEPPPFAEYDAEGMAFDHWQLAHLHPCTCGGDTVAVTPCEIHCTHCGHMVAALNWLDCVFQWQRDYPDFPDGAEHPMVEACEYGSTFPKPDDE